MSGGVPPCMTVVSLVLKASFSSTVILIFTFGWAAVYSVAIVCQSVLPGSWVLICHHSMVTCLAGTAVAGTAVAGTAVAGTAVAGTAVAGAAVAGMAVAGAAVVGATVAAGAQALSAKAAIRMILKNA